MAKQTTITSFSPKVKPNKGKAKKKLNKRDDSKKSRGQG